jgi:hypothetical protein
MKNPSVAHLVVIGLLSYPSTEDNPSSSSAPEVLSTLRSLPPTTASFEIYGRLLQDVTCLPFRQPSFQDTTLGKPKSLSVPQAQPTVTIAEYIRTEALGAFLLSCIEWIDVASAEEREGFVSDDSVGRAVQLVSLFLLAMFRKNRSSLSHVDIVPLARDIRISVIRFGRSTFRSGRFAILRL